MRGGRKMRIKKETLLNMIDTIKFYALPETYFAISIVPDRPSGEFMSDFSKTKWGVKPGKRARRCLLKLSKEAH
jgi:hypothetical protein